MTNEQPIKPAPDVAPAVHPRTHGEKCFLFLQSHPSFFGRALVRHMRAQGAACHLINLSLGDWLFRFGTGAVNYTGTLDDWRAYLEAFVDRNGITSIVYYADQRPYHRIARSVARQRNIEAVAYEFGYLRPDWITLERGGMGAFSHFPDDPDLIEALASVFEFRLPDGHYPYTLLAEACNEMSYHLLPVYLPFLFPHYQRDRYYHPLREYLSYIPKFLLRGKHARRAGETVDRLLGSGRPYYVMIMQMQGDYQVRRASRYPDLREMIDEVLGSFLRHAPSEAVLVFKMHPLENSIERWPQVIRRCAAALGCLDRVEVIDGGDLSRLYSACRGVVVLNSTAALPALMQGVPVKTLGIAIYDIPRLTAQEPLDDFWIRRSPPVARTLDAFIKLLAASIQVKGNFFTREGRALAVQEVARRLMEGEINTRGAFIDPPPRLVKARAMGVPMIYED